MWSRSFRVGLGVTIGAYEWQRSQILGECCSHEHARSDLDPITGECLVLKQVDHFIGKLRQDKGPLAKGETHMQGALGLTSERFEISMQPKKVSNWNDRWEPDYTEKLDPFLDGEHFYIRDNKLGLHLPCASYDDAERVMGYTDPSLAYGWRHGLYHWRYLQHLHNVHSSDLDLILRAQKIEDGSWMFTVDGWKHEKLMVGLRAISRDLNAGIDGLDIELRFRLLEVHTLETQSKFFEVRRQFLRRTMKQCCGGVDLENEDFIMQHPRNEAFFCRHGV